MILDPSFVCFSSLLLSFVVVGSDGAGLFDNLLNNLHGGLEVLIELELVVFVEGPLCVLGYDTADTSLEDSLEDLVLEQVRRTPVVSNALYEGVELNVDADNSVVCSVIERWILDPSVIYEVNKGF